MPAEFRHIDFAMPGERKQKRSPMVFFILFALALFLMLVFTGINI
jgi:predicted nucleic acid-binding Zn ribbon protein